MSTYRYSFDLLRPGNPVFEGYAFYTSILVFKMVLMSLLTAMQRFRKKAFVNAEDAVVAGAEVRVDEDVERVRRAHLNDLENIPLFMIIGLLYVLTDPNAVLALTMFRVYTLARIIHTIVYAVYVIRQPARGIAFFVGFIVTIIMALLVIASFHHL